MVKRTSRIAEEKKNSRREKRQEQNRIGWMNEKVENLQWRRMKQVELSKEWNLFVKEKIRGLQKAVWTNEM